MKTSINIVILAAVIGWAGPNLYAQISAGGTPPSFSDPAVAPDVDIQTIEMPPVNMDSLLKADSIEHQGAHSFQFGYDMDVDYGLSDAGKWETLGNGDRIWRLCIYSKNAYSINLIYDDFWLPDGARFYVYSADREMILGAFTSLNNKPHGKFSTDLVKGDKITLEYYEPASAFKAGQINIDKVIHGYRDMFNYSGHGGSSNCNIDINCAQGDDWCIEQRSVSMILLSNNTRWCSGALINNVREDLTPYYLGANHCLNGDEDTWMFRFRYWNPGCNNGADASSWISISGGTVRANSAVSDFALIELSVTPQSGFGMLYAGWSNQNVASPSGASITHPRGDVMKIALYNQTITQQTFLGANDWRVEWAQGTVEPTSSGGPLFNNNHLIIGQVHGGIPANICTANDHAFFGRFDVSWNNGLSGFLDPDNTGANEVGPTSPLIFLINRTFTNTQRIAAVDDMHLEGEVTTTGPFGGMFCQPSNAPFTTQPGSNVTFRAGGSITVKPGVHFMPGSRAHLTLDNLTCNDNLHPGDFVNAFCTANVTCKVGTIAENVLAPVKSAQQPEEVDDAADLIEFRTYPTPFRSGITIEFSIPADESLTLRITNIYGQEVAVLMDGNYLEAGTYKVEFDATDLANGIYFCSLSAGEFQETHKLIKVE